MSRTIPVQSQLARAVCAYAITLEVVMSVHGLAERSISDSCAEHSSQLVSQISPRLHVIAGLVLWWVTINIPVS